MRPVFTLALFLVTCVSVSASCGYYADCTVDGVQGVCTEDTCCSGGKLTSGLCPGGNNIKCCTNPSCSTSQGPGTCKSTAACNGTSVPNHCKGPADMQCCVGGLPSCSTPYGNGVCEDTTQCTTGTPVPGYCSGTSSVQCCVQNAKNFTKGVDWSQPISSSSLQCMLNQGWSFGIRRAWRSSGSYDPAACTDIKAAHKAGFTKMDVYMFPCPKCSSSGASQVAAMVEALHKEGCEAYGQFNQGDSGYGRVWLDIEGFDYWSSNVSSNQAFFKDMVSGCLEHQLECGVYTSKRVWGPIMGDSFVAGELMPLWYPHYDSMPAFSDFVPFGGWQIPYMKQYLGDETICSFGVDGNFLPG